MPGSCTGVTVLTLSLTTPCTEFSRTVVQFVVHDAISDTSASGPVPGGSTKYSGE